MCNEEDDKELQRIILIGAGNTLMGGLTGQLSQIAHYELPTTVNHGDHFPDFSIEDVDHLNDLIAVHYRQSFRQEYRDRIDRYKRIHPRHGCPTHHWNYQRAWLPRFYSKASRRLLSSQSRLRLSRVLSLQSTGRYHQPTDF